MIVMIATFSQMKISYGLFRPTIQIPNGLGLRMAVLRERRQLAKAQTTRTIYIQYNEVNSHKLRLYLALDIFPSFLVQRA